MSETTANKNRTRRRVVRQAGPPVEDGRAGIEVRESVLETVSPEPDAAESSPAVVAEDSVPSASVESSGSAASSETVQGSETVESGVEDAAPEVSDAETPVDEADDADAQDEQPRTRLQRVNASLGRLGMVAAVVALVSVLVLGASGGLFLYHQHRADALESRRAEYIQVAKQAYLDMVTVKSDTAGPDLDRLMQVAGGGLKDDLAVNKDDYKKLFEQMKVQSSGKILSAALERDDADSATVLLLAQQTVSNAASNGPMLKDYRFRVTVVRNGGTVSATDWELVP